MAKSSKKTAKQLDKQIDKLTVKELRRSLSPDRNMSVMLDNERGFGVIVADRDALDALIGLMAQHGAKLSTAGTPPKDPSAIDLIPERVFNRTPVTLPGVVVSDHAGAEIDKITIGEFKAKAGANGLEVMVRPDDGGAHYLLLSAAGNKAEFMFDLLVEQGILPHPAGEEPGGISA